MNNKDMYMKAYEENGLWLVANAETNEVLYACSTEEEAYHFICINRQATELTGEKDMKCYRIYVDNGIVATVFSSIECLETMNKWLDAGFENVEFKIEQY